MEGKGDEIQKGTCDLFYHNFMSFSFSSGCSSNTKTGNEGSGSNGTKEGGVLTIARLSDADNLDPHFITNIPSASVVYHKVYENLVQRDKTWILSRC